ncbi:MAG: PorT family protein [Bacteroides sp.]|nr:PorT family protein [Bacteroides sp.]
MNFLKKAVLVAVALIAGTGLAAAGPFSFGVKAGLNVNKLTTNPGALVSSDNSCGWTAGVMADFTVPIIGIGADISLMYSRMNNANDATFDKALLTEDSEASKLYGKNFLMIPLNVKYKITIPVIASIVKPYVFTGPSFNLNLDGKVKDTFHDLQSRTFTMAWNFGLGVELINHVQVSASYGLACNRAVERLAGNVIGGNIESSPNIKNNYWTVTAAYLF